MPHFTADDGVRLRYEIHPGGPKHIMFIMGFASGLEAWTQQVDYFLDRRDTFSLVLLDNRGSGHSEAPSLLLTTKRMAHDAIQLLEHIQWHSHTHLVGVSMGGMIAMEMLHESPSHFNSVTLINTHAGGYRAFPSARALYLFAKALFVGDEAARLDSSFELLYGPRGRHNKPFNKQLRERFVALRSPKSPIAMKRATLKGILSHTVAVNRHYVSKRRLRHLGQLGVPILVLVGDHDLLIHPENSYSYAKYLGVKPIVYKDVGHALINEAVEFHNDLERHIDEAHRRFARPSSVELATIPVPPPPSPLDRMYFLGESYERPMTITGVGYFDEMLTLDLLCAIGARWVTEFPALVCVPSHDTRSWVRARHFHVSDHVTFADTDGSSDAHTRRIEQLVSVPLPRHRPLWDAHVLRNPNGSCVLCVRLSHAIGDGAASVRMLMDFVDKEFARKATARMMTVVNAHRRQHQIELDARLAKSRVWALVYLVGAFFVSLVAWGANMGTTMLRYLMYMFVPGAPTIGIRSTSSERTQVPDLSDKQVGLVADIELADVKKIGRAMGVSVNDIMLSCLAGAVARTSSLASATASAAAPRDALAPHWLLKHIPILREARDLACIVPFNMRLRATASLDAPGNHSSICVVRLPCWMTDRRARAQEIHRRMMTMKKGSFPILSYLMISASCILPDFVTSRWIRWQGQRAPILLTNVPGPDHEMTMDGRRISSYAGVVPCPNEYGIGVCVFSYAGRISVSFNGARALTPSPQHLAHAFTEEWRLMQHDDTNDSFSH